MVDPNAVVLITGAARRIGAGMARFFHQQGVRLVLHYRSSSKEAQALADELNADRANSVVLVQGDLLDTAHLSGLMEDAVGCFGRLDGLVNNASSFFPTDLGAISLADWDDLMGSNLKAPLFLSQAAFPYLSQTQGAIVGVVDIHAERPMKKHVVYNLAKAGHAQLIRSLALEMAPFVRVNGVAPGCNIWPESDRSFDQMEKDRIEASIPMQRIGSPLDIAEVVFFLMFGTRYVTGQILAVDGGRGLVL